LEPIQFPGAIQPHGALLAVLGEAPWLVSHASANLAAILGKPAEEVLGRPLEHAVGEGASQILQQAGSYAGTGLIKAYHLPAPGGETLQLNAHRIGRHICVDIEPLKPAIAQSSPIASAQSVLETFRQPVSCQQLCELAVDGLSSITGYDRVIAYRFCEDGHGEVIAEARGAGVEPFLGLHYPTADVSMQARRLFLRHRVESIPDANYQPVNLLIEPALDDGAQLDLTHSALRSVSPMQRAHMRSMGTAASVTIALVDGANLWGMLICHHLTARRAGPEVRAAVDLIGQVASLLISPLNRVELDGQRQERSETLRALIGRLAAPTELATALAAVQAELLGMVNANGAIVRYAGTHIDIGLAPPPPMAERILTALQSDADGQVIAVDNLAARAADFAVCAKEASGALLVPLGHDPSDVILWFRPEKLRTVVWGANLNEPTVMSEDSAPTPRHAAKSKKQTVRNHSAPWTPGDLALVHELRRAVDDGITRRLAADLLRETQLREVQQAELRGAISALQVSEGQLNAVEMRLERAQATAGIGSWELNVATGRLLWSKEVFRIRGILPGDLDKNTDDSLPLMFPDDRGARQSWLAEMMAGNAPGPYECKIVRPDGEARLVRIEGGVVRGPDGGITHVAGTLQDISERRQIERQLAHAQKMEALGILTGGMAHVFNNMLGVIMVNLELLQRLVTADAAANELCGEAVDGATRCADLIRSLLAFAGRQPLHSERTEINALVYDIARLLRRTLGEHITLVLNLDAELWPTTVDPAQFETALLNLATNAREAMPQGGRLDITTRNLKVDATYMTEHPDLNFGDYALIEVSDTGVSIPADIIGRIFDPFFTTKAPATGTGLGLSMAFGFAKQSGGHLAVYSEASHGTTFQLFLPRSDAQAPA
jgi:PAS domain S-box-containing protein